MARNQKSESIAQVMDLRRATMPPPPSLPRRRNMSRSRPTSERTSVEARTKRQPQGRQRKKRSLLFCGLLRVHELALGHGQTKRTHVRSGLRSAFDPKETFRVPINAGRSASEQENGDETCE